MLQARQLEVRIRRLEILRGVSLDVPAAAVVGLVGRNGAGKTTTLRSLMGLMPLHAGTVALGDADLARVAAHRRAELGIGYMPEDRRLIPTLSVEQNLLLPVLANRLHDGRERLGRVYARLPEVEGWASRRATQLSGGQQKLVALARALVVGRRLLLLDEPFEGVAPALAERMGDAILAARDEDGVACLLAESEHREVERLADRIYTIERGAVSAA